MRHRVLGGAIDLGFGFVGVGPDPDEVVIIPQGALDAAGIDPAPWWPVAVDYLERVGAVAAQRLADVPMLRPIGDCDVVTLLASKTFRAALCSQEHTGMRAAAVPMRRRGWLDLSRIDPAFTVAAAAATDELARGFSRPLLVTADEVTLSIGWRPAGRDRAARQGSRLTAPAARALPLTPRTAGRAATVRPDTPGVSGHEGHSSGYEGRSSGTKVRCGRTFVIDPAGRARCRAARPPR